MGVLIIQTLWQQVNSNVCGFMIVLIRVNGIKVIELCLLLIRSTGFRCCREHDREEGVLSPVADHFGIYRQESAGRPRADIGPVTSGFVEAELQRQCRC